MNQKPKLCEYNCGQEARFQARNSKRWRCSEKINDCPGFHQKTREGQMARWNNIGLDKMYEHMKVMSLKGNSSPIKQTAEYKKDVGLKISKTIKRNGGRKGERNSSFGTKRTLSQRKRMQEAAACRDNSNIGKYERTNKHRDALSKRAIQMHLEGKFFRTRDTKPEREFAAALRELSIDFEPQFLIQFGSTKDGTRFRHCYDFWIKGTNILVEVDGDYWHSLPEAIERDRECEKVAEQKGYYIIRVAQSNLAKVINCLSKY